MFSSRNPDGDATGSKTLGGLHFQAFVISHPGMIPRLRPQRIGPINCSLFSDHGLCD
jgi:hypothetical protein